MTGRLFKLQVEGAGLRSPGIEVALQRLLPRALAERQRGQAVLRQHQQLATFVTADVLRHHLAFVQQAHFIAVGADGDGSAHELRRHGIAIAVEGDAGMRADHGRHDFVGVEGEAGQRPQQGPLLLEAIERPLRGWSRVAARWPPDPASKGARAR